MIILSVGLIVPMMGIKEFRALDEVYMISKDY